jgi:hypothetical protein
MFLWVLIKLLLFTLHVKSKAGLLCFATRKKINQFLGHLGTRACNRSGAKTEDMHM